MVDCDGVNRTTKNETRTKTVSENRRKTTSVDTRKRETKKLLIVCSMVEVVRFSETGFVGLPQRIPIFSIISQ